MGGVMNSIGNFFTGVQQSAPEPEPIKPVPIREEEAEPESAAVRDEERRKLRQRRGMAGTVLTSPLGTMGTVSSAGSGLLGRSGS